MDALSDNTKTLCRAFEFSLTDRPDRQIEDLRRHHDFRSRSAVVRKLITDTHAEAEHEAGMKALTE